MAQQRKAAPCDTARTWSSHLCCDVYRRSVADHLGWNETDGNWWFPWSIQLLKGNTMQRCEHALQAALGIRSFYCFHVLCCFVYLVRILVYEGFSWGNNQQQPSTITRNEWMNEWIKSLAKLIKGLILYILSNLGQMTFSLLYVLWNMQ